MASAPGSTASAGVKGASAKRPAHAAAAARDADVMVRRRIGLSFGAVGNT
jgi:hypothetical protein